ALVFVEFVTAFVAGFAVAKFLGLSDLESVVIGGMLPFASTVIVVKFLMEKKIIDWPESRVAISSLIIEDFAAILVLVFLTSISSAKSLNFLVVNGLLFVVAAFFIVSTLSRYALGWLRKNGHEDKMALYAVGIGILVGYLGQVLDLSSALGAYFAGFALAETAYAERIKRELGLFREFFILFFFVSFGATITLPTSLSLYLLLGLLLAAYVISKIVAYGIFGSAVGLKPKAAITIGAIMLPIGEFSIIIASAASALLPVSSPVLTLAFLLTVTTGVAAPVLFSNIDRVTGLFLRLYPPSIRKAFGVLGKEIHVIERHAHSLENEFWTSVRNLLTHFVIALSVVYVAAVLNAQLILPTFPNLPSSATLALLALPFIVWPVYRTLQELRYLSSILVSRFVHPDMGGRLSEVLTGSFSLLASVFAGAWLYSSNTPPLFLLLPLLYLVLSLVFLSRAVGSFFERLEGVSQTASAVRAVPSGFLQQAKAFDTQGELLSRLTEIREKSRIQISEALSAGHAGKARTLLADFRRRESTLLDQLKKPDFAHPFKEKARPRSPHLERYFVGRGKKPGKRSLFGKPPVYSERP
ncbi:MAG TPA: cation:proton antiporter, partial [Candidatus Norongarragalinales archaeon]|nr:cation:proton antiporter [Candidatus Norongarragalinales archaeon]